MNLQDLTCSTILFDHPITHVEADYTFWILLSGEMDISSEDTSFSMKERDIILIQPGDSISVFPKNQANILQVRLLSSFVNKAVGSLNDTFHCNSVLYPGDYSYLLRQLAQIVDMAGSISTDYLLLTSAVYKLLNILQTQYSDEILTISSSNDMEKDHDRVNVIRRFIHSHYNEHITLEMLAEHVYLTPQYFSKFFKKNFGIGFLHYLTELRLQYAIKALADPANTITKIALDNGFANLSAFDTAFIRKFGISARSYRKNMLDTAQQQAAYKEYPIESSTKKNSALANFLTDGKEELNNTTIYNVKTDAYYSDSSLFIKNWNNVINLGNAEKCLNNEFQKQLRYVSESLHFHYARITNIFYPSMLFLSEDGKIVGLSLFTRIINLLKSMDMIPFLDLGARPISVSNSRNSGNILMRANYSYTDQQWESLLTMFLSFCINTWDFDYVSQWRFELWLPRGLSSNFDSRRPDWYKHYTRRFQLTQNLIHTFIPDAKLGGPGINLEEKSLRHFSSLFSEMSRLQITPDFISVCMYPCYVILETADQENGNIREDIASILNPCGSESPKYLKELHVLMHKYFKTKPDLCISEYGFDATSRSFINDTIYRSAYIIRTVINNLENANDLCFSSLSDLTNEDLLESSQFFGGNGMMTRNSLRKASYYAYWLLDKLGNHLISKGSNHLICSKYPNHYEVLLHNFKELNEDYCQTYFRMTTVPLTGVNSFFSDNLYTQFTITLAGISQNKYLIKRYVLDRFHGDVQKGAKELLTRNSLDLLRQEEIEYLSGVCVPEQNLLIADTSSGTIEIQISLQPNATALFMMTPYLG